jgi:protein-disulfide isomerase
MSFDPSLPTEQNPLSNQALTKKQRRDLKRQEKVATKESIEKSAARKRIALWAITGLVIIGIVFGMIKLAQMPNSTQTGTIPPVTEKDWKRGNPTAPAVLVDYSDFQCPACGSYHPLVKQLIKELSTSTLRFVARNFPLPMHENADEAARAAEAAGKQNKYWEMHDLLFDRQSFWESETKPDQKFLGYAELLGLNTTTFMADYHSDAIKDRIQREVSAGEAAGVDRTPLFFLNGERLEDLPTSYEAFKKLVTDAVK